MKRKHLERLIEFLFIGVGLGLLEDLIAITLSTDAQITITTIIIVFLVALPFAIISELIVDHKDFHFLKRKNK